MESMEAQTPIICHTDISFVYAPKSDSMKSSMILVLVPEYHLDHKPPWQCPQLLRMRHQLLYTFQLSNSIAQGHGYTSQAEHGYRYKQMSSILVECYNLW